MADKPTPKITTGGKEYHARATELLAKVFTTDPVLRFMLSGLSDEARLAYLPEYMHSILKAAALNDASFVEANDFSCCAVWMPPGKRVDNPFTILQAGLIGVMWRGGWGAVKVLIDASSGSRQPSKLTRRFVAFSMGLLQRRNSCQSYRPERPRYRQTSKAVPLPLLRRHGPRSTRSRSVHSD